MLVQASNSETGVCYIARLCFHFEFMLLTIGIVSEDSSITCCVVRCPATGLSEGRHDIDDNDIVGVKNEVQSLNGVEVR